MREQGKFKLVQKKIQRPSETDICTKVLPKIIGSLIWFARMTRPDLSYLVSKAATVSSNPNIIHRNILLQAVGYLKKTIKNKLIYKKPADGNLDLTVYSDSNWIGKESTYDPYFKKILRNCASTSGIVIMVNGTAIHWNAAKQKCIAASAMHAEIIAADTAMKEATFTLSLLKEFGYNQTRILTFIDNQAAINSVTSESMTKQYRFMDLRNAIIRRSIQDRVYHPTYVPTENNLADVLTKSYSDLQMSHEKFNMVIAKLTGNYYETKEEYLQEIKKICENNFVSWNDEVKTYTELLQKRKEDIEHMQ